MVEEHRNRTRQFAEVTLAMTSETSSPTPTDSPSLSQRPLLSTAVVVPESQQPQKKTVEFAAMDGEGRNGSTGDHAQFLSVEIPNTNRDPESLTLNERRQKRGRLTQPRMSLLGKPLNYRASRRDARYRRVQSKVYNFLERPRGLQAVVYHMLVFCMVFLCLALSVFSTIKEYEVEAGVIFFYTETVVVTWFALEFSLRLWSSGCRSRYQGSIGRLKFLRRPFCIIDVTTIIASLIVLGMGSSQVFAASALRGLRFFQILRMVRIDRRGGTWKLLGSVVYAHRQELITTLYIGFLGLIFASFLVYLAEKDVNKKFSNFAQALWWGVITLCTVGYGDMVPETWQGKIITSFCALLGISFFALPAGILGSGFALKVQQQQRQKHMIRRRQPAATLIQSLWRCYAADEHSLSVATWKIHETPLPTPPPRVASSFKHNASFVSRLPTIRRHKTTSLQSPSTHKGPAPTRTTTRAFVDINTSAENLGGVSNNAGRQLNANQSEDFVQDAVIFKKNSDDEEEAETSCVQLTSQHKGAIRAIRKLKYFVARKKFREALKPYDVKDVIEQYSSGHADLLNRVKSLHLRLDQILGKQGSKGKDVYASKISLASRVVKVERQVDDIEMKLDQLIDLYMEDRKRFMSLPLLQDSSNTLQPNSANLPTPHSKPGQPTPTKSLLKPKPILVDKQFSEPSSPITKVYTEEQDQSVGSIAKQPVQQGSSDLGKRIKKRVTLSSIPSHYICPSDEEVVIVVPADDEYGSEPCSSAAGYSGGPSTSASTSHADEHTSIAISEVHDFEMLEPPTAECSVNLDLGVVSWLRERGFVTATDDDDDIGEDEGEGEEQDDDEDEEEDVAEDTAMLRTAAANTEIVITPISGNGSGHESYVEDGGGDSVVDLHLLRPEGRAPKDTN